MSWTENIPGCFGSQDKIFAGQYNDCQRAAALLQLANQENISWTDYITKIEEWLRSQDCTEEHIREQMERVKDLRKYFNY